MNKELPWTEKVPMFSINPNAASNGDVARLASELMEARSALRLALSYPRALEYMDEAAVIVLRAAVGEPFKT